MPANLPPQYYEAEKLYRQAKTPAEKIEALETMLAIMPKHKGTEHLRAELRERIARLTREAERQAGGASRARLYEVTREGAGQVVLVGLPNVGKSRLAAALTGAPLKVADYPFTTRLPQPAMLTVENVPVQVVDTPPIVLGNVPPWLRALIRGADVILLVVDLAGDPLAEWETLAGALDAMHILLRNPQRGDDAPASPGQVIRPTVLAATRHDLVGGRDELELLELAVAERVPVVPVSAETGEGIPLLQHLLLDALAIIRVYSKPPGRPADLERPFVLRRGATVSDLAELVHRQVRENLKYAIVWGRSGKFAGQRVGPRHILEDGDIVELVT